MALLSGGRLSTEDFRIKIKFQTQKCQNLCTAILSPTLLFILLFWSVGAEEEMICQDGIKNFTGVTYPRGDLIFTEGDPLDVYCSVNLTHPEVRGYNASNLEFQVSKHEIPENLIQRTIINETTIRMRVDHMNSSIVYLDCVIRKENGESVPVSANHVEVGLPPIKPKDFNCVAWNWTKLMCTWTRPFNTIETKYNLSFSTHTASQWHQNVCPEIIDHTNGTSSCEWDRSDSPYRAEKKFSMVLKGTNALNKPVVWTYIYDHFSIVVPGPPTIKKFSALSSSKLRVKYTFKYLQYFAPGLEHEISLCSEGNVCNIITLKTKPPKYIVEHQFKVPYANTLYRIRIRMRSLFPKKTELFWSTPVSANTTSFAKIPDTPPTTAVASFEVCHNNSEQRDIYIYWQEISPFMKNGFNFHYEAILYKNGYRMDILPKETNGSYTEFVNLEASAVYKVDIFSVNDVGRSVENYTLEIPASQKGICNTDANLTDKVREISLSEGNEELFKDSSQEGYTSCIEEGSWVTWTTMSAVSVFVLVVLAFGSVKCWTCCKEMNNFDVKLPPGLQNELSAFSRPTRRKTSVEDFRQHGKKDETDYALKHTPSNNQNGGPGIHSFTKRNKETEDCSIGMDTKRIHQSALNPLADHPTTDDEDALWTNLWAAEPYVKLGKFPDNSVPEHKNLPRSIGLGGRAVPVVPPNSPSSPKSTGTRVENDYSESHGSSSSTLSPNSSGKVQTDSSVVPDDLTTTTTTDNVAYVTWSQLFPDDFRNDTSTNGSTSYCHYGPGSTIVLECAIVCQKN